MVESHSQQSLGNGSSNDAKQQVHCPTPGLGVIGGPAVQKNWLLNDGADSGSQVIGVPLHPYVSIDAYAWIPPPSLY
jgi:hypothetical protein